MDGAPRHGRVVLELIEEAPHPVHRVPTRFMRIRHAATGEELGTINLRLGGGDHLERYAGHVGYAVDPAHRGKRYAAEALRQLVPLARELGADALWITCDPDNLASRRTCELAGGCLVEVVDVPPDCVLYQSGHTRKCRFLLSTRSH